MPWEARIGGRGAGVVGRAGWTAEHGRTGVSEAQGLNSRGVGGGGWENTLESKRKLIESTAVSA